jgi:hypothetical protein
LKLGKSGSLYVSLNDWVKPEGLTEEHVDDNKTYRSSLEGVVDYPESTGPTAFNTTEETISEEDIPF